jgi:CCR4-NOT transcription complex subunit 4
VEKERQAQEKAVEEEKERTAMKEKERQAPAEKTQADKARAAQAKAQKAAKSASVVKATKSAGSSDQAPVTPSAKQPSALSKASEPAVQAPILSKMPKKNKPVTRPIKIPKEDEIILGDASAAPSTSVSEGVNFLPPKTTNTVVSSSSNNSRAQSVDTSSPVEPTSLADLLDDIDVRNPSMDIPNHPFFDIAKINPAAKMPLEYGPLVHALSALSVGGGSFATNMPSGSIDNAVSSFQQLLETLTQTISDLLRLLPRTTWDDSSSFDGVLRDMLKGDDFLDDGGDDAAGKEDEVAALTLALERRARWMEVQLSKLEELHRDINTAAVRAVLAFNDSGWDRHIFMPRVGNTLRRFDNIGMAEEGGKMRPMTVDELEKKLQVAKEAAIFAETEFREAMEKILSV